MAYINCHSHTATGSNLRLRDSINKPIDLINYAHELGHKGICITDHESIAAHLDCLKYYNQVKDNEEWSGFKLGLGNEIYLCPLSITADNTNNIFPHFILIALDAEGHKGLRELSTRAWIKNSFMSVMMRVPTYYTDLEEIMHKYKGHIIGSTACIGGSLPRHLLQYQMDHSEETWQECIDWIEYIKEIFGEGYFFLELQPGVTEEQKYVNKQLIKLSEITKVDYLISTDAHYTRKEDRFIHKIFLNSQDGDREVDTFYNSTYVMSEKEIHEYMDDYLGTEAVQKGIDNTMLVYDKLQYYDLRKSLEIPYLPFNTSEPDKDLYEKYVTHIPLFKDLYESSYDSDRHLLRELTEYIEKDKNYQTEEGYFKVNEALDYLLISSNKMGVRWSAYLLQVADYVKLAWDTGTLVGAGRGSGVGFCLLHMLGITQINPMLETTKTYPARFLNPERASVLDIDIDIEGNYRDKVVQALKDKYGEDRVSKVLTFQTEKSKSAILTAARGLGIDNDTASYIASLVIFDRGQPRTLKQMYYGDDDNEPSPEFVKEMDSHSELWEVAQKIEGLCCGSGSHAGGVIIADKPLIDTTALMRTNSGDIVTQYDLHMCEDVSLIKIDLLCIDALDKIHATLDLLLKAHKIEWQGSLKDTYEKYIGIYSLERNDLKMWQLLWEHKVPSFFQMEKASGKQALALAKPRSVDDLATINSVIRLMAQKKGAETPLQKYARFHEDITLWYKEMEEAGLTQEEQDILKDILGVSFGICEAQEFLMLLVMHPKIGGFSLGWSDKLRKAVAKKLPKEFLALEKEFFENAKEKQLSQNLVNYVWYTLIYTQRGYGFNKSHTLAYSLIGLQELNLCYKFDPIYYATGNLICDSGSSDEESNDGSNYGKLGTALGKIMSDGVAIANPDINTAEFGFVPDEKNHQIIYGLKGINAINTELAQTIINNRPYKSFEDFCARMIDTKIIKHSQMIMLIKAGCFINLHSTDKKETMIEYLKHYKFKEAEKLTLSQLRAIKEYNILPEDLDLSLKVLKLKEYVIHPDGFVKNIINTDKKVPKCGYHDRLFVLDEDAQNFFTKNFTEDSVVEVNKQGYYIVSEKKFVKECDTLIQPLKDWFTSEEAVNNYNKAMFKSVWDENASGSEAKWSMQALTYYDQEHELAHIDEERYGIVNFYELPVEPEPYEYYTRYIDGELKELPKYRISRVAGTVIDNDSNHHTVTLLTCYGIVMAKFYKESFAHYNRRISAINSKGEKKVLEEPWFKRGTLIIVAGFRRGDDEFVVRNYTDTIYAHTTNKILAVNSDGSLEIQQERTRA